MRWVFLVVGLAVGYALGVTGVDDDPHTTRRDTGAVAPHEPRDAPARPPTDDVDEDADSEVTGPPKRPEPRAGEGILEVMWPVGVKTDATLYGQGLRGEQQDILIGERVSPDVTRQRLPRGKYSISATSDAWPGRRQWHFFIEGGDYKKVDLTLRPRPGDFPIPDGLGRLEFTVYTLDGRPMPGIAVQIIGKLLGKEKDVGEQADRAGKGRVHLRPGRYRMRIGSQERQIRIVAGKTTTVAFRYRGEGAVIVQGVHAGHITLMDAGPVGVVDGRLVYAHPGRYRVALNNAGRDEPFVVGHVDVRAGQVTRFKFDPPPGDLHIGLKASGKLWAQNVKIRLVPLDGAPAINLKAQSTWLISFASTHGVRFGSSGLHLSQTVRARYIRRGLYRVEFSAKGWKSVHAEVEVGEGTTELTLPIEQEDD